MRFARRVDRNLLVLGIVVPGAVYLFLFLVTDGFGRLRPREPRPSFAGAHTELVAVLVSARFCGANQGEGFRHAIPEVLGLSGDRAAAAGHRFRSVGVSVDWDPVVGLSYLRDLAQFDEMTAGGNWLNSATERHI